MKHQSVLLFTTMMTVIMLASNQLNAQDRIKEVGLAFRDFDGFGLTYKTGTSATLWRLNSLYASGYSSTEEIANGAEGEVSSYSLNFQLGREYRKPIMDELQVRIGFDLSFNWYRHKVETLNSDGTSLSFRTRNTFGPGLNGVLGLNYVVKEKLVIGAEVMPGFGYSFGSIKEAGIDTEDAKLDTSGWNFSLSTSSAMLTLAYRIIE